MRHFCDDWIKEWCEENGWTDLFIEHKHYWAFPPGAVIPEPIPTKTLKSIKAQKGLCSNERILLIAAAVVSLVNAILGYWWQCPMPFVFAFAFCAIAMAKLEVEL